MIHGLNLVQVATHSVEDRSRVHALTACRSSDTGLGGLNGSGKSTSLRLVTCELTPTASVARTSVTDPFSLPPFAALLEGAYSLLDGLTSLIHPIAGRSSAALAILILTGIVRAFLVPVGASQVKAEGTRRRLYPQLIELQRRNRKDPFSLQQKTAELYRAQNASQFSNLLPTLAQAPVLSVVDTLFLRITVDGHANALLDHQLFSAALSGSFLQIGGGGGRSILIYLVLFAVLAVVAAISRRITRHLQLIDLAAPASAATLTRALSWLPFTTIVFAAIMPLAAALYLAASATWTLGERVLLRRWCWGAPERSGRALSNPLR